MLKILEREIVWKYYYLNRILTRFTKPSVFPKTENQGTDLTGKWDQNLFAQSDVNAYQEASKILAFQDSRGTKGSFITDIDGNIMLDLCGTENLPLGHNHTKLQ